MVVRETSVVTSHTAVLRKKLESWMVTVVPSMSIPPESCDQSSIRTGSVKRLGANTRHDNIRPSAEDETGMV